MSFSLNLLQRVALLPLALAACGAVAEDAGPGGRITLSSGTYLTFTETTVLADDRIIIRSMGRDPGEERLAGRPGLYADLAALLAAEGPGVAARVAGRSPCPDWGQIIVIADPPVGDFSRAEVGCPEPDLSALAGQMRALIDEGR